MNNTEHAQVNMLRQYYNMLYPEKLRDNEYIRLIAIKHSGDTVNTVVKYVKNFEEYQEFILQYRYSYDVYNQIATNKKNINGSAKNQRYRKVFYLDFDRKDYPDLEYVTDFSNMIKKKFPQLFIHAIYDSGHGYHCYISIDGSCKVDEIVRVNRSLAEIVGADLKAVSPTQISRPPCTYNHKNRDGHYNYEYREEWSMVRCVFNDYDSGKQFKAYSLEYIAKMIDEYYLSQRNKEILKKEPWNYELLNDYPCYLCVRKMLEEGADIGERNFWHGRIVKLLQMEGYSEAKIYSMCQEYNRRCRPPKSEKVIESDTKRFLDGEYRLLGCYESMPEMDHRREWIRRECDKYHCGTYHNGAKISLEGDTARMNRKLLKREIFQSMTGNKFLVLTLLEIYKNSYGRMGFRVRNLKRLLYSSIQKRYCISEDKLKKLLLELEAGSLITLTPDRRKPKDFNEVKIRLARKLNEFQQGYIEFYFTIAGALIDGKISQTDYMVYLALLNNLQSGKSVTYDSLAESIGIKSLTANEIGKHIRKLAQERCLIIEKRITERGYQYNHYKFVSPEYDRMENTGIEQLEDHNEPDSGLHIRFVV